MNTTDNSPITFRTRMTGFNSALLILLAMFFLELQLTRMVGDEETSRFLSIALALVRLSLIYSLLLLNFAHNMFSGAGGSPGPRFPIPGKWLSVLLFAFVSVAVLSGVVGATSGYSLSFVTGDLYKFSIFPLCVLVVYATVRDRMDFNRLLLLALLLYSLFLVKYAAYYLTGIIGLNQRPTAIYIYPFMPLVLGHLRAEMKSSRRTLNLLAILYIVSFPILVWYSQSLSLILQTGFLFVFSWMLRQRPGAGTAMRIIAAVFIFATAAVIVSGSVVISKKMNEYMESGYYLPEKFRYLRDYGLTLMGLELLGGDRVAQLAAVLRHYGMHPAELISGRGMGSVIVVRSVSGLTDTTWGPESHFIEGGYPEVLYRTGILGLMLYVLIFLSLFRKSLQLSPKNRFCSLAAAYSLYILVFSVLKMGYVGEGFGSLFMVSLLFAGTHLYQRQASAAATRRGCAMQQSRPL